jgi:hypothetical protein
MFYSLFSIVPKLLDRKIMIAYSFNVIASPERAKQSHKKRLRLPRRCAPRNDNYFPGDCFAPSSRYQ